MICIVGCNHGIQTPAEDWLLGNPPDAREQKEHFKTLLDTLLIEGKMEFVGEEWGLVAASFAKQLASQRGLPWCNINTADDDLEGMGIPFDYIKGPYSDEQKAKWHSQRESFMFNGVQTHRNIAKNVLLVCGFIHVSPLAVLFSQNNEDVRIEDYRIRDWYRPGVFTDDC